jgi:hypothetical protein
MKRANLVAFSILSLLSTTLAARSNDVVCQREPISMLLSPDNDWIAMVQEGTCSNRLGVTVSTDIVQLVPREDLQTVKLGSTLDQPEHDNDILSLDYYGHFESRPTLKWISPKNLQITVPNISNIGLKKKSYRDVTITLRFEPDDPVAREKWRKERGLPKE